MSNPKQLVDLVTGKAVCLLCWRPLDPRNTRDVYCSLACMWVDHDEDGELRDAEIRKRRTHPEDHR